MTHYHISNRVISNTTYLCQFPDLISYWPNRNVGLEVMVFRSITEHYRKS